MELISKIYVGLIEFILFSAIRHPFVFSCNDHDYW